MEEIISLSYSNTMNTFLFACFDGGIQEWERNTNGPKISFTYSSPCSPTAFATKVHYTSHETEIFTSSIDCTVLEWNLQASKITKVFLGHYAAVTDFSFHFDNIHFLSCSDDSTFKEWNRETGKLIKTVKAHDDSVNSICYSPDGTKILTASSDGTVKEWDRFSKNLISVKYKNEIEIKKALYSNDGKQIFCLLDFSSVVIISEYNGKEKIDFISGIWYKMAYDKDMLFLVNGINGDIIQISEATHKVVTAYKGSAEQFPTSIACKGNRLLAACRSYDKVPVFSIREWNTDNQKLLFSIPSL